MKFHDDGSGPALFAGGIFTAAGPSEARGIAKWNGSDWTHLGLWIAPADTIGVRAMATFDDGGGSALFIGGSFVIPGSPATNRVARWDGARWVDVPGLEGSALALAAYDDGSGPALFAGGSFQTAGGGQILRGVARRTPSGWSPVGEGFMSGSSAATVYSLETYDDGSGPALYAGGNFTHSGGVTVGRIARWTGKGWNPLGAGLPAGVVYAITKGSGPGGPTLFAGGYALVGGVQIASAARWDGSAWSVLGSGPPVPAGTSVRALTLLDHGSGTRLYAGCAGSGGGGLVEWDGTAWQSVSTPTGTRIYATTADPGPPVPRLVAGVVQSGLLWSATDAAMWNGSAWTSLGEPGGVVGHRVQRLTLLDSGSGQRLHAVGAFAGIGGTMGRGISRLDPDGWVGFGAGLDSPWDAAVFDDGTGPALYACGGCLGTTAGECVRVARFVNGSWITFGPTLNNPALALEVYDDGTGPALFVGGSFGVAPGASPGGIARWDGGVWDFVGGGVTGSGTPSVRALAVSDVGGGPALYVGGLFHSAGGTAVSNIAAWNGLAWSALGSGLNFPPEDMISTDLGTGPVLIVSGGFTIAGGQTANGIARWDGSHWSVFGTGLGVVRAAARFDDGAGPALYAAGDFTLAVGAPADRLAKWDGVSWSGIGDQPDAPVYAMLARENGAERSLWLGGVFGRIGAMDSGRIARRLGCPTCYSDCDNDGSLASADFACFQSKFVAGSPYADCTADGALTVADFGCFQTNFVQGCP